METSLRYYEIGTKIKYGESVFSVSEVTVESFKGMIKKRYRLPLLWHIRQDRY